LCSNAIPASTTIKLDAAGKAFLVGALIAYSYASHSV
jgi:hypothetical protein